MLDSPPPVSIYRELARQFSGPVWNRGVFLWDDAGVLALEWDAGDRVWYARVKSSHGEPWRIWLTLDRTDHGPELDGECECPAEKPCKHMAATIHAVLAREGVLRPPERRVSSGGPATLPGAFSTWAEQLRWLRERASRTAPAPRRTKRLVFVVGVDMAPRGGFPPPPGARPPLPVVNPNTRPPPTAKSHSLSALVHRVAAQRPTWIDELDLTLWYRLLSLHARHSIVVSGSRLALPHCPDALPLFTDFVATGRCRLDTSAGPTLSMGEPRPGALQWRIDDGGTQTLQVVSDHADDRRLLLLPLAPLHAVDVQTGVCSPLALDVPDEIAPWLLAAPTLDPLTATSRADELRRALAEANVPPPRTFKKGARRRPAPIPRLHVRAGDGGPSASLVFEYDDHVVDPNDLAPRVFRVKGDTLVTIERDPQAEARAEQQLAALGLRGPPSAKSMTEPQEWMSFGQTTIPSLARAGWRVQVDDDVPWIGVAVEEWIAQARPSDDDDGWFLELGVVVDGVRIDVLPTIVAAIREGVIDRARLRLDPQPVMLSLPDGRRLALEPTRLQTMLDVLVELQSDRPLTGDALRLARLDALRLEALAGWTVEIADKLRANIDALRRGPTPVKLPKGLLAELRHYQSQGLAWLQWLRKSEIGGILADDMGLGKTVQALAHLLVEKRARRLDLPALVVAPKSVLRNWLREAERFTPALRCALYHGPDRAAVLAESKDIDVVVTTYALLQRDEALQERSWSIAVLDEAQNIKNPLAKVALVAHAIRARQRICMTGTPMENNLGDLWSLMTFANPGLLGSALQFSRWYRTPIEKDGDVGRFDALCRRVAPFMLRRTKAQVLSELPPKTEIVLHAELAGPQRDLYESVRMTMEKKVRDELARRGFANSRIIVLDALLKLRQVCCHPPLVKLEQAQRMRDSAKLELLVDLLRELTAERRRAIVFSQFTSMLTVIERELDALGIPWASITGATQKRQEIVDRFQTGVLPVLLVSLKAGGTGLNLTAADTVIHYDPWWNPAVEAQATDRAHRIGQIQPITVYRLICEGTVEERMLALQARKAALLRGLQDTAERRAASGPALDERDLAELFAPLERGQPG